MFQSKHNQMWVDYPGDWAGVDAFDLKRGCFGGGGGDNGGGQQQTNTVEKSDPWEKQQPFLEKGFEQISDTFFGTQNPNDANAALGQGVYNPTYFEGSTIVPFSDETNLALQAQTNRATFGSPISNAGRDEMTATLRGDYLDAGNPYFQNMTDRVTEAVMPTVDAKFARSGRFGSGMHNRTLTQGLSDSIGSMAYKNFGDERTNMARATFAAPQMAQQDYFDISKLAEVGATREGFSQAQLNDEIQRHNFEQQKPINSLAQYMNMIQGSYGGQGTATATSNLPGGGGGGNMLGGPIGGAMLGGGAAYMLGATNPIIGAAALGGGLLGLF